MKMYNVDLADTLLNNALNIGVGLAVPARRLHIYEPLVGAEQILETGNGLADWKRWNFILTGGAGVKQTLSLRILNDLGTAATHTGLQLGTNVYIRSWEVNTDPVPNAQIYLQNKSNDTLAVAWYSTVTSPDVSAHANGRFSSGKVFNAVWNDIVDFLELEEPLDKIEYGKVYVMDATYKVKVSSKYAEDGIIGIASDTYGFGVGSKNLGKKELPVSIGGFVLAYVDKEYRPGTPLTSSFDGFLTEVLPTEKMTCPEKIIATYLRPEPNDEWNGIKVDGRRWVKIK
jgi:hypothetical protein